MILVIVGSGTPHNLHAVKHTHSKVASVAQAKRTLDGLCKLDLDEPTNLLRRWLAATGAGADEGVE